MPEGLQYALSGKLSDGPSSRVTVVASDEGPSLLMEFYIQEAMSNSLQIDGSKPHVHLVLVSHNADCFSIGSQSSDVTIYDCLRNPSFGLENLSETLNRNVVSRPGRVHIMIIDDYAMFSILSSSRDARLQGRFLRFITTKFRKMFLFFHKDSLSVDEISTVYDCASDIAFLHALPDASGNCSSSSRFLCDLLKIRKDRRASHQRTVFQIIDDEIKEELIGDIVDKSDKGDTDILKNLTTFKLTLEDEEKISKSKLHLPYFEAQKTSLEDPENFDDFEDDEEDEEA